jgi:hypothetical protein
MSYYRPDYDRVMRAYLTHRRATHYNYRINFVRRTGWDDLSLKVDCRVCAVLERQLHQAKKPAVPAELPNSLKMKP